MGRSGRTRTRTRGTAVSKWIVLYISCSHAIHHSKREAKHDDHAKAIEAELPSTVEADKLAATWAMIWRRHGGNVTRIFDAYNCYHDRRQAEPTLSVREVRAIVRDVGVSSYVVRRALAEAAIKLLDSSGDGYVSKLEFSAGLGVLSCWSEQFAPPNASALPSPPNASASPSPMHGLRDAFAAVHGQSFVHALTAALEWGVRPAAHRSWSGCSHTIAAWWDSGWTARLAQLEAGDLDIFTHELAMKNRCVREMSRSHMS